MGYQVEFYNDVDELCDILKNKLPRGSGIDCEWALDAKIENDSVVIFNCANSFHAMNDTGYYIGFFDFHVNVSYNKSTKKFDFIDFEWHLTRDEITSIEKQNEIEDSDECGFVFDGVAEWISSTVIYSLDS